MLELTFITTSKIKLNHAIHLCRDYDVDIAGYKKKYYGKGYEEPRIHEREELLKQSIADALKRWEKNVSNSNDKFFFIEDTSVRIHGLSCSGEDVPGVDIKYWMQENDFDSVDRALKQNGNDRRVVVRSDVLLILTRSLKKDDGEAFVRFSSEVSGTIVDHEYEIATNPVYPWLDNKTFNKWFVPNGCNYPISMLTIAEADKHDFRVGAFQGMLGFLLDNNQIKRKDSEKTILSMRQMAFPIGPPLFIVSGPTCAGKTTLAEHMISNYGYYHVEASDFMYLNYYRRLGIGSSTTISEFAKQALSEKPDIVVDEILKFMDSLDEEQIVVTGLRTTDEIDLFRDRYRGSCRIEILTVSANEDSRLNRYLVRNRGGSATKEKFYNDSQMQNDMGLSALIEKYLLNSVRNEGTIKEFYDTFDDRYRNYLLNMRRPALADGKPRPKALQDAIIIALYLDNCHYCHYLTTSEVANLINRIFSDMEIRKSKTNVSRYFNQSYYPYFEAIRENGVNKYRLSQTGRMHAQRLSIKK